MTRPDPAAAYVEDAKLALHRYTETSRRQRRNGYALGRYAEQIHAAALKLLDAQAEAAKADRALIARQQREIDSHDGLVRREMVTSNQLREQLADLQGQLAMARSSPEPLAYVPPKLPPRAARTAASGRTAPGAGDGKAQTGSGRPRAAK